MTRLAAPLSIVFFLACSPSSPSSAAPSRPRTREAPAVDARALSVRWIGNDDPSRPLVVLLHGWGAPGDDLVPLAERLVERCGHTIRIALPEAPLERPPSGRAWWQLSLGSQRPADRGAQTPAGLREARADIVAFLEDPQTSAVPQRTVLAGFSQGALLATDVGLEWRERVAGIAILSGGPLNETRWTSRMHARPPPNIFLSHGRFDPLLSFDAAQRLRETFEREGANVQHVPFDGGHAIPAVVVDALVEFLRVSLSHES